MYTLKIFVFIQTVSPVIWLPLIQIVRSKEKIQHNLVLEGNILISTQIWFNSIS